MTCQGASQNPSVTEPQRDGGGEADEEGFSRRFSLSPAIAGALPKGEPLVCAALNPIRLPNSLPQRGKVAAEG